MGRASSSRRPGCALLRELTFGTRGIEGAHEHRELLDYLGSRAGLMHRVIELPMTDDRAAP